MRRSLRPFASMLVAWLTLGATWLFAVPVVTCSSAAATIRAAARTSSAAVHLEDAAAEAEDEGEDEDPDELDGDEEEGDVAWDARCGAARRAHAARGASRLLRRGALARAPDDPATATVARPPDC